MHTVPGENNLAISTQERGAGNEKTRVLQGTRVQTVSSEEIASLSYQLDSELGPVQKWLPGYGKHRSPTKQRPLMNRGVLNSVRLLTAGNDEANGGKPRARIITSLGQSQS